MGASVFALSSATMLAVIAAIGDYSSLDSIGIRLTKGGTRPPGNRGTT
jgi:hypothetical protein